MRTAVPLTRQLLQLKGTVAFFSHCRPSQVTQNGVWEGVKPAPGCLGLLVQLPHGFQASSVSESTRCTVKP